uniref:Inner membrane protein n=1 Tax=Toxoplasma gondii COUG TaxID=1074873 RepID=A0A2G8XYH9_TOXGO|nr:inner membrane protein [Toxoplasma gondii COUG]
MCFLLPFFSQESANRRLAEELKVQCELRDEREAQERRQMVLDLVELEGQVLGLHAAFDALSLRAQQAQAVNSLMSVVAEIDNALEMSAPVLPQLKKLQEMSRLDPILFSALNSLPCEVTEATHRPVPTAGDLKVSIKKNLRECIQAAFIPPHSGIFGHLLARAFSWFYVLEPHPPPIDPETSADPSRAVAEAADLAGGINAESALNDRESSAGTGDSTSRDGLAKLRRNLALLSYASFYVDRGHLGNALRCLEQLDGLSRAVSLEEIQRLRVFLLLHQTLQLAKARLACINADLLAGAKSP